jgi:integrase
MADEWSLISADGRRKYLVDSEYEAFVAAAGQLAPRARAYCLTLAGTGGRLSEVLALRKKDVDRADGTIIIKSLKKRGRTYHRPIRVKPDLISTLDLVFDLGRGKGDQLLWPVDPQTGYRWVMRAMELAKLDHTPHALRHTFGVHSAMEGVPLTTLKKWLGHANLKTTAIYAELCDAEERKMAERMWR